MTGREEQVECLGDSEMKGGNLTFVRGLDPVNENLCLGLRTWSGVHVLSGTQELVRTKMKAQVLFLGAQGCDHGDV